MQLSKPPYIELQGQRAQLAGAIVELPVQCGAARVLVREGALADAANSAPMMATAMTINRIRPGGGVDDRINCSGAVNGALA